MCAYFNFSNLERLMMSSMEDADGTDKGSTAVDEETKTKEHRKISGYLRMVAKKSKAGFGRVHDELSRRCAEFLKPTPPSSPKYNKKEITLTTGSLDVTAASKSHTRDKSREKLSRGGGGRPWKHGATDNDGHCNETTELPECDWCFGQVSFDKPRHNSRRHTIDMISDRADCQTDSEEERFGGSTSCLSQFHDHQFKPLNIKNVTTKRKNALTGQVETPSSGNFPMSSTGQRQSFGDVIASDSDSDAPHYSVGSLHAYANFAGQDTEIPDVHKYENIDNTDDSMTPDPRPHDLVSDGYIQMDDVPILVPTACRAKQNTEIETMDYVNAPVKPSKSKSTTAQPLPQDEYILVDNYQKTLDAAAPSRCKTLQTHQRSPRAARSHKTNAKTNKVSRSDTTDTIKANTTAMEEFYQMSVEEVVECLKLCILPSLAEVCDREGLDGEYFRHVTRTDLKKPPFLLDIFYTEKLFRVINGWRPKRSK